MQSTYLPHLPSCIKKSNLNFDVFFFYQRKKRDVGQKYIFYLRNNVWLLFRKKVNTTLKMSQGITFVTLPSRTVQLDLMCTPNHVFKTESIGAKGQRKTTHLVWAVNILSVCIIGFLYTLSYALWPDNMCTEHYNSIEKLTHTVFSFMESDAW